MEPTRKKAQEGGQGPNRAWKITVPCTQASVLLRGAVGPPSQQLGCAEALQTHGSINLICK